MIKEAMLWRTVDEGNVSCSLCAHRCRIAPGDFGICGVRQNREGKLFTLVYGEVVAAHVDPIEKKPFFHFLPGTTSFSIATAGCNFRCGFCQNWKISQVSKRNGAAHDSQPLSPEDAVRAAVALSCRSISYTYTEPTIFFEYAHDTAKLAKEKGLYNNFVTNGYMTAEALEAIRPYLDAANVDLKSFKDETYKKVCKARLEPVFESIRFMKELEIWIEVTTLVVPGLNDGEDELAGIARFIAGVDRDIPWHISRFHPDFEYKRAQPTPVQTLEKAMEIGKREGLRYVYIGNLWGEFEDTHCPTCGRLLIRRRGFQIEANELQGAKCPTCATTIAGVFK